MLTRNPGAMALQRMLVPAKCTATLLCIFQALSIDADFENLSIDSTSIKAHPQSAGAKKGLYMLKIISISALAAVEKPQKFMQ